MASAPMDLQALADFVAVVQAGGISAGARQRGEPKQSVSRRLMGLEQNLGLRLFERSTRSLRLTADGALLNERAQRILADLEDTRRALADRHEKPEGLLRVSAPVLLGQTLLGDVVARLVRAHPQLQVELALSDRRVDLIEEGFDAAIRVGPIDDSGLVARRFALAKNIVVGAPSRMPAAPPPPLLNPADLARWPCILFGQGIQSATWSMWPDRDADDDAPHHASPPPAATQVTVRGPVVVNSLKLAMDIARTGAGLASVPAFVAQEALQSGDLVRMLPGWHSGLAELRVVFSSRRLLSARLRAFVDALVEAFPEHRLG